MPIDETSSVSRRAFEKIEKHESGCWLWTGAKKTAGYGNMLVIAHRFVYELLVGPIPDGMHLDHFGCDNPSCVNPEHMRIATPRENTFRAEKNPAAIHSKTESCPQGHPYDEENTYLYTDKQGFPHRLCRACRRDKNHTRQVARAKKGGGQGYPGRTASSA